MQHALRDAIRYITRFERGSRTLIREVDEDPLLFNASFSDKDSAQAEGPDLHLIIAEEYYGTLGDGAPWSSLG